MAEKSMIKSAFILTIGNIVSRFLGLIYVFPFSWLVKSEGQALYSYAYVPYIIFLDLATLGIPIGIAKFVSIYNAVDDYYTSYKIYKKTAIFMYILGFIMFFTMFFLARPIAYQILGGKTALINNINDVTIVIRIISTALIVVPTIALMRGFFQGFKLTYQTALSQIVEQLVRVLFILLSAFIIIKILKLNYTIAIYFAVFAATLGSIVAFILLKVHLNKHLKELNSKIIKKEASEIKTTILFKQLFKYAMPLALFGIVSSLYSFIDTLTFNKAYSAKDAINSEIIYGTYAFEINKLIMIPVSLGMALGVTIIIYISESYTKKQFQTINQQIIKAVQTCTFIILPIVILMMTFANGIYSLLYQANNVYGAKILLSYAPVVILLCFNHIINGVMQSINKIRFLTISMLIGVSLKFLYNSHLISQFGYNGAILATAIGLFATIAINVVKIVQTLDFKHLFIVRRLLMIFSLNILIGLILYVGNFTILKITINYSSRLSCLIFVFLNTLIYLTIYILLSYFTGLIDIIYGKSFNLKDIYQKLKNKSVMNKAQDML